MQRIFLLLTFIISEITVDAQAVKWGSTKHFKIDTLYVPKPNDTTKCVVLHFDFDPIRFLPGQGIRTRVDSALLIIDNTHYPHIAVKAVELLTGRQIAWEKILLVKKQPYDIISL